MNLSFGKLVAAISLWLSTIISSMLPLLMIKKIENGYNKARNFRVVSFLSCFGGGVFMATCLLHLLPNVQDSISLIFRKLNIDLNFPASEFLLCFGFLLVLIAEQIVLNCQENNITENLPISTHEDLSTTSYQNYGAVNETCEPPNHAVSIVSEDSPSILSPGFDQKENYEAHSHEVSFHQDLSSHSILRSLLLVFALSLHSIFEGLAIGLQLSTENVIRILLAVIVHKCIIAFTLGLNLAHSRLKKCGIIKANIFFSLASPIGIVIGLVVMDFVTGLPMLITSSVLQGLAAGTFMYVTFFEVLPHELNSKSDLSLELNSINHNDRMIKIGCLILGFSVVSVFLLVLG